MAQSFRDVILLAEEESVDSREQFTSDHFNHK